MFVLGWHCGPQRNGIIAIVYGGGPAARKRDYLTRRSKSQPEHLLLYGLLFLVLALGSEDFKGIGGLRLFAQAKSLHRHRRQSAPLPGQGQLDFDKLDKMVRIVAITEKRGHRLCVVARRPSVPVPVNDTFPVVTMCPEDDSSNDTILADKFLVTNEKRRKLIFSFTLPEEAKKNLQRMCEIFAKNYGKTPSKYGSYVLAEDDQDGLTICPSVPLNVIKSAQKKIFFQLEYDDYPLELNGTDLASRAVNSTGFHLQLSDRKKVGKYVKVMPNGAIQLASFNWLATQFLPDADKSVQKSLTKLLKNVTKRKQRGGELHTRHMIRKIRNFVKDKNVSRTDQSITERYREFFTLYQFENVT